MKSLQNKLNLIKEGKGNKELFLKEARAMFPNVVTGALTFDQAVHNLTERGILSEGFIGVSSKRPNNPDWFQIFNENVKAELKDTDKDVEKLETAGYDYKDEKNSNNLSMESILTGYYAEMKDPKNAEKTEEELKEMVVKNLTKDPMHYVKDGQFGVKGLGYTDKHPGLGGTKEVTGKYKSSGMEPVKLNEISIHDPVGSRYNNPNAKSEIDVAREILAAAGVPREEIQDFITKNVVRPGRLSDKAREYVSSMELTNESKHSAEADLKIHKSELNMLNKIKPTGEKQLKRKAELEKKIADLESKMNEIESETALSPLPKEWYSKYYTVDFYMDGPRFFDNKTGDQVDYMDIVKHYEKETGNDVWDLMNEIGMLPDPVVYKKSEPNPKDLIFTKKFVGTSDTPGHSGYIYDIYKNGVKIKTIEGEGNANAYINQLQRDLEENDKESLNEDLTSTITILLAFLIGIPGVPIAGALMMGLIDYIFNGLPDQYNEYRSLKSYKGSDKQEEILALAKEIESKLSPGKKRYLKTLVNRIGVAKLEDKARAYRELDRYASGRELDENLNADIESALKDLPVPTDMGEGREKLKEGANKAMEKAVKEIEKKSELAKAEAKVKQIDELISELESKLSMTEAEGVSEMVDKKKVKEIQRNIKFLEAKKKRYDKEKSRLEGKYGEKKKEIMDEVEEPKKMGYGEAVKEMLKAKGLKK